MTAEQATRRRVTIALDADGGDDAPGEVIAGAALAAGPALEVLLVGRPESVQPEMERLRTEHPDVLPYLVPLESGSVIASYDEPAQAVRSKRDASIVVGAQAVADGRAQAFVSAGSTGGMLAAGLLVVKRVPGVKRPAIVTVLPGMDGPVVLLDAGANADCHPEHLLEFGALGSVFARVALAIPEPRVGLLNIGEEESKGNKLALATYPLLAQSGLRFVGNVEGRDVLFEAADVVVTDGFTGNVALKLLEGTARAMLLQVRQAAESDLRSKLGGLLLRPALRRLRSRLDPESYGGTYLLGVRGLVVICHGNSNRTAIANALRFAADAVRGDIVGAVEEELPRVLGRA